MTSSNATASPNPKGFTTRLAGFTQALRYATTGNPVLVKEFRTRMRGTRAYWLLFGYTFFLAGVLVLVYFGHELATRTDPSVGGPSPRGASMYDLGTILYGFAFVLQAILVALITPAITAGSITVEHEQRSYDLLVTTPLKPGDLIRGKLLAAVSFVGLLLTAALPLVSLSFLVGGVSPAEIICSYLVIIASAALYGAIGLFWSSQLRTTAAATALAYVSVLTLFIVTMIPGLFALAGPVQVITGIPFQSVNGVTATYRVLAVEQLFGLDVPSWTLSVLLNVLAALVVSAAAIQRLAHFTPPSPALLRTAATALWIAVSLCLLGNVCGYRAGFNLQGIMMSGFGPLLGALAVLATFLNTGTARHFSGPDALPRYLAGLSPRRMFQASLPNGLPLILLWALAPIALMGLGLPSLNGARSLEPAVWIGLVAICLTAMSAQSLFGHLASLVMPHRGSAVAAVIMLTLFLYAVPYGVLQGWRIAGEPSGGSLAYLWVYASPLESVRYLNDPGAYFGTVPQLLFGHMPPWIIQSLLHAGLAVVCFVTILGVLGRRQAVARRERKQG